MPAGLPSLIRLEDAKSPPRRSAFSGIQGSLLGLLLLVLIPILAVQAYFFYERYRQRKGAELQANLEIARAVGRSFSVFIHDVLSLELSLGTSFTLRDDLTVEQMNRILEESNAEFPSVRNFSWIDPKGRIVASSLPGAIGLEVTDRAYLAGALSGREWVVSDLYLSAISGEPIFGISRSVRGKDGSLLGIVLAAVDVARLDDLFAFERDKGGGIAIVDSRGTLVYRHPRLENLAWEARNWLLARPFLPRVLAGEEVAGSILAEYDGKRRLSSWAPIKSIGWAAGAGRSEDEVLGPIRSIIFKGLGATLLIASLSFAVAFAVSRRIAGSVSALRDSVLSFGRHRHSGPMEVSGPEELQDLARAFGGMTQDIADLERERAEHLSRIETELERGKQAEIALEAERARLQAVLDSLPVAVWIANPEGTVVQTNQAVEHIWGKPSVPYGLEKYQGYKGWWADTGKPLAPREWALARAVLKGEVSTGELIDIERFNGERGTILNNAAPVRDSEGRIIGGVAVAQDITERKRAEEALRLSEQEKSLILDHANELIAFHDTEHNLIWANRTYLKSTGLALSELRGRKCYACWTIDRLCSNCPVVRALETGQPQEAELTPENQPHWPADQGSWHVRATAVRDSAGKVIGAIEMAHEITERKRAEKALRESEERYRGVVQKTTAVILRVDPRGIIRFANERALQFFGYSADELMGKHAVGTILPEKESTGRDLAAMVDAIAANPEGFHSNANENMRKSGERVWMEWTNSGVYDADGSLIEFLAVGIDATERKRAEQELREMQAKLSVIVDSIADGFYALDHNFRFTHINDTALSYFKTRRQDMIGRSVFEVFPKVWGTVFETRYRRAMETGEPEHFETLSVATGQVVEMHAYPGRENLTVLFRDISERKRMEKEQNRLLALAQQRNAETEAVFEALNDAVLIYDTQMNVQRVNPVFLPTYGFDPQGLNIREIIERTRCRWLDGRPFRIEDQPTPRALKGDTVLNQQLLITRLDGRDMALETSSGPLRIGEEIVGSVTVWHNITERKRMEEELRKSRDELDLRVQERTLELEKSNRALAMEVEERKRAEAELKSTMAKLEESNQALQDFASVASHDLQEPLRKVSSFGNMLKQQYGEAIGENGKDYLVRMLGASDRMSTLLKSLLDYSRVSTRAEPFREVDLGAIVSEVLTDLEVRISSTGGEVQVGDLPMLEADPTQMRQLFQNLIGNALKFHREGVRPVVRVRRSPGSPGTCEITVEDNGIGFDEKYLERIFAPFHRLHGRSSKYEGTGMGLAICKKIVERHGGSIGAESEPGKGSTFRITLPVRQADGG